MLDTRGTRLRAPAYCKSTSPRPTLCQFQFQWDVSWNHFKYEKLSSHPAALLLLTHAGENHLGKSGFSNPPIPVTERDISSVTNQSVDQLTDPSHLSPAHTVSPLTFSQLRYFDHKVNRDRGFLCVGSFLSSVPFKEGKRPRWTDIPLSVKPCDLLGLIKIHGLPRTP